MFVECYPYVGAEKISRKSRIAFSFNVVENKEVKNKIVYFCRMAAVEEQYYTTR